MSDLAGALASLAGPDEWARHQALEALRDGGADPEEIDDLVAVFDQPDATRRAAARMALAALAEPGSASREPAQAALREALDHPAATIRILAASALGEAGDTAAGDALVRSLEDEDANVRAAVADALGALRYAPAVEPLGRLSRDPRLWIRAAAVVALGEIRDVRALPHLAEVAREPGLEVPVSEALARIDDLAGLPVLETVAETAPDPALRAAGSILSADRDADPPEWVRAAARRGEEALRYQLVQEDDPAVARLLGFAGTRPAIGSLLDLLGPPRWSEAAIAGILATPGPLRAEAILDRLDQLDRADPGEEATLLSVLPPLQEPEQIEALVPYLAHESDRVRTAAAEALARAPSERALPLLARALDREGVAPEVVRALGSLGDAACMALVPLLDDPAESVRTAAANALTRCAGPGVTADLRAALERETVPAARESLIRALALAAGADALDVLDRALDSRRPDTRLAAIEGLGAIGDPAAVRRLEAVLDGDAPSTGERLAAIRALGELGVADAAPRIAGLLGDPDLEVRRSAARAAVRLAAHLPEDAADRLLDDDDPWIRLCGARLLGAGEGNEDRLDALARTDPDPSVRSAARRAAPGSD